MARRFTMVMMSEVEYERLLAAAGPAASGVPRREVADPRDEAVAALGRLGWRYYCGGVDGDMVWVKGDHAISSRPGETEAAFDQRALWCARGGTEGVEVEPA